MNFCVSCGEDFGSVSAFDAHRVGNHAYTSSEGLQRQPMLEDGRRCLSLLELKDKSNKDGSPMFTRSSRGRWSLTAGLFAARGQRTG